MPSDRNAEFKEAFQLFDKDGDGCITTKELGTVMRALGKSPTEAEVKKIVSEVDPDGRGFINFPEFCGIMGREMREFDNEADLKAAWKVFDKDGKGSISVAELRHVLSSIGEKLSPEELADLTKEADPDTTGRIQYDSFIKLMMSK
mmetsp:Transcript_16522/g.41236  ORF Transcript_16522/g.41236 Transcript_16522/m.41236 type:complete len:146 (-) Transcript_16522:294-731(-)|eukprot:CAMPEP_0202866006 /NCGR_PEP_ID=MMETSP1391-20130828/6961_1 /ASSEMBLY_ACC=CAM_ASM_000867 /TAXON_ID=1034604 /ORGANISM="Chlamydomonas leiostraca, Strain SAG 11-49" /LENGTH=145 /DNA_ID=CAMNT_0049545909 /DNA_START=68 /DNA_END=505 /DNA_ORIENTATION=+